jgi:hypothetical protein
MERVNGESAGMENDLREMKIKERMVQKTIETRFEILTAI